MGMGGWEPKSIWTPRDVCGMTHASLVTHGLTKDWKEFRKDLRRIWREATVSDAHFFLDPVPGTHITHICDSFALYMALWQHVTSARASQAVEVCASFIRHACLRALGTPAKHGLQLLAAIPTRRGETCSVLVDKGRAVLGWKDLFATRHPRTREVWAERWGSMRTEQVVIGPLEGQEHLLTDVAQFAMFCLRERRTMHRKDCVASRCTLHVLCYGLVGYLSEVVDQYITGIYLPKHGGERSAPALVSPRRSKGPETRKYVSVQPETVWELIEQARSSGCSLEQVVKVRDGDAHVGCAKTRAIVWMSKYLDMYRSRRAMAFHGARHLCVIADPATHQKRETLASVCWSWEFGVAAHGDLQVLPATAAVLPSEQDLPDHISQWAAELRVTRASTFRQLQALSSMIQGLGQWQGLQDFLLPPDFKLHPVRPNEVRVVQEGVDTDHAWHIHKATGCGTAVLPASALVLGLDQGSVGAAGAAFADFLGAMLHVKWDKCHSVIRDIRLSITHCGRGLFLKAQLYTSYLWGINQKPFGTGLFLTQKTPHPQRFLGPLQPCQPRFLQVCGADRA